MTTTKKNISKLDQKPQALVAEVLPAQKATPATTYTTALAKADAVISSAGGACRGVIRERRTAHGSVWQTLLEEDQATRAQILQLKAKENEVLGAIRDRVASNLMETIDAAVAQGVLEAPEEV